MASCDELDTLLNEIGLGRWQALSIIANFLIWFVLSPHTIGTTLFNAPVPFECLSRTGDPHSLRYGPGKRISNASEKSFSETPGTNASFESLCLLEEGKGGSEEGPFSPLLEDPLHETLIPSCPYVRYDVSVFESTVTTEWHLICERAWLKTFFQNAYTVGLIFGCLVGGDVGDRVGRAKAVFVGSLIHAVATVVVASTTNLFALLFGRFVVGVTNLMILIPIVTLALETCPERRRGPVGMIIGAPYSAGVIAFAGLGVLLRDWRHLYIATSFPALLLVPVTWLLDESPRWLLQKGHAEKAKVILEKAARMNGVKFESADRICRVIDVENNMAEESEKSMAKEPLRVRLRRMAAGAMACVRTPAMRKIAIVSPLVWCFNEIVYYGTIFNANAFSNSNPFLYVALTGVSDGLAVILGIITTHFSRKMTVGGAQLASGTLLLLVLAVPHTVKWLQWILVMSGFLMCACASQALYVYTPELFPTSIRARGFAFSNLAGYLGTFAAPFVPDYLAHFGWWTTGAVLGTMGLVSGTLIMCLIETNRLPLCETIQDVESREKGEGRRRRKRSEQASDQPDLLGKEIKPLIVKDIQSKIGISITPGAVYNFPES